MPRTLRQAARAALTPTPTPVIQAEPEAPQTVTVIVHKPFFWGNQLQAKGASLEVPVSVAMTLSKKGLI
jgi:hypothetical protein